MLTFEYVSLTIYILGESEFEDLFILRKLLPIYFIQK